MKCFHYIKSEMILNYIMLVNKIEILREYIKQKRIILFTHSLLWRFLILSILIIGISNTLPPYSLHALKKRTKKTKHDNNYIKLKVKGYLDYLFTSITVARDYDRAHSRDISSLSY